MALDGFSQKFTTSYGEFFLDNYPSKPTPTVLARERALQKLTKEQKVEVHEIYSGRSKEFRGDNKEDSFDYIYHSFKDTLRPQFYEPPPTRLSGSFTAPKRNISDRWATSRFEETLREASSTYQHYSSMKKRNRMKKKTPTTRKTLTNTTPPASDTGDSTKANKSLEEMPEDIQEVVKAEETSFAKDVTAIQSGKESNPNSTSILERAKKWKEKQKNQNQVQSQSQSQSVPKRKKKKKRKKKTTKKKKKKTLSRHQKLLRRLSKYSRTNKKMSLTSESNFRLPLGVVEDSRAAIDESYDLSMRRELHLGLQSKGFLNGSIANSTEERVGRGAVKHFEETLKDARKSLRRFGVLRSSE
eukprot:g1410.t1